MNSDFILPPYTYLNEFTWPYNHREDERAMFDTLVRKAASSAPS